MKKIPRFDSRDSLSWNRQRQSPAVLRAYHLDLFTPRGWATVGSGVGMVFLAYLLGRHELMALGMGLIALSLSSWIMVLRTRKTTRLHRRMHAPLLTVAEPARFTLNCPDEAVIHEILPEGFGPGPVLQGPGAADYELVFRTRGTHLLGPAQQVMTDPLGLIRGLVSIGEPQPVAVRAQLFELQELSWLGERILTGDARISRSTTADYYDVATRDYQQGDSIRQVHWKATARHGKLMVRQENHVATAQALLVLDLTRDHWFTSGTDLRVDIPRGLAGEFESSRRFENALSVACSLAQLYAARGYQMQFRDFSGEPLAASAHRQLSEHSAQTAFEDFHLASADLSLKTQNGTSTSLVSTELGKELVAAREEPAVMICGDLNEAQANEFIALSRTVRHVELFLLIDHPERYAAIGRLLSRTGWKIHYLPGNAVEHYGVQS